MDLAIELSRQSPSAQAFPAPTTRAAVGLELRAGAVMSAPKTVDELLRQCRPGEVGRNSVWRGRVQIDAPTYALCCSVPFVIVYKTYV